MRRALSGGYELDDDRARIDVGAVHEFISTKSYWGLGRSRELVERAVAGSTRVVGLYRREDTGVARQVGFARAVSDGASFAYLADVYVLPAHRGKGLGLELVREIVLNSFGEVRWLLHTADAQALYAKVGFVAGDPPYPLMERAPTAAQHSATAAQHPPTATQPPPAAAQHPPGPVAQHLPTAAQPPLAAAQRASVLDSSLPRP